MVPKSLIIAATLLTMASGGMAQYSISYQWLNFICATNLNCNEGCSACDVPESSSSLFFGTNMVWIGTTACPHPVSSANNALYTSDWPLFPADSHYGLLSGISLAAVQVDSLIIVHRREVAGPQRVKVSYTDNLTAPFVELGDVDVTTDFATTVFTDLGCLNVQEGMPYAAFQLKVQPYQSEGGQWHLDEVRIVASPCAELSTGIGEYRQGGQAMGPYFDVLGRPVRSEPAPGVYVGPRKQVQIF